jgi:hypothetical protein
MIIKDDTGRIVRRFSCYVETGLNAIEWELRFEGSNDAVRRGQEGFAGKPGPLVQPGMYSVILRIGAITVERTIEIAEDINHLLTWLNMCDN